ncbi:hypothetical protein L1887_57916 [Cichorium endivia]|nr:hypothetical protein L1887_57916 [Cichorium endivia]
MIGHRKCTSLLRLPAHCHAWQSSARASSPVSTPSRAAKTATNVAKSTVRIVSHSQITLHIRHALQREVQLLLGKRCEHHHPFEPVADSPRERTVVHHLAAGDDAGLEQHRCTRVRDLDMRSVGDLFEQTQKVGFKIADTRAGRVGSRDFSADADDDPDARHGHVQSERLRCRVLV